MKLSSRSEIGLQLPLPTNRMKQNASIVTLTH